MSELTLYDFYLSSSSYRVRIALNAKGIPFKRVEISLPDNEQKQQEYRDLNPQGLVPMLVTPNGNISQSLAILEWLEENYPKTPLLPVDSAGRARVRSLAFAIAMDIQPLNNLRVMNYFKQQQGWEQSRVDEWYQHWIATGFAGIESQLQAMDCEGRFCFGDTLSLADVCLVPQVLNARRFQCDLAPYPLIRSIDKHCRGLNAFADAAPEALRES